MRKNSLTKVSESNTTVLLGVRPSSRGKLSSLSKKVSSKGDVLELKVDNEKESGTYITSGDKSSMEVIIWNICCILKNLSANKLVRKDLLKEEYLRVINRYLLIWNEKSINQFGTSILVQLTSATRHMAPEEKSYRLFLKSNCFDPWTRLVEMFPTSNDLIFNMLRIFSKLSSIQECCEKLN